MRRSPPRVTLTVLTVVGLAAAALAATVRWQPAQPSLTRLLLGLGLGASIVTARLFPLHLVAKTKTTICTAPLFALALLLPAPYAVAIAAVAYAIGDSARRRPL